MNHINQIIIVGNLTRDAIHNEGKTGLRCTTLSVASNYKTSEREDVCFVDVKLFGESAIETADLKKGQQVIVQGRLKEDSWTDKSTGEKRTKMVIMASQVETV